MARRPVSLKGMLVEEPYLLAKHGETYRAYTTSVGRFMPGVGVSP